MSSFTVSPGICKASSTHGAHAQAACELLARLVQAGGASTPGQPAVTRIYHMGMASATRDALTVKGHAELIYTTFVPTLTA